MLRKDCLGGYNGNSTISSTVTESRKAISWATSTGARRYGSIDRSKIATAGHSCGGIEALSTAYHEERVKRILLFDISIFEDDKRYLPQAINVPVAWFEGGPLDFTSPLVQEPPNLENAKLIQFTQATTEHILLLAAASLGQRQSRIFNGNSETMSSREEFAWILDRMVAWYLKIGR